MSDQESTKPAEEKQDQDLSERLAHAYEQLAERTKAFLEEAEDRSEGWIEDAVEKGKDALEQAGDFTRHEAEAVRDFLVRDLEATRGDFQMLAAEVRKRFDPSRLGAGFLNLVESLAEGASEALEKLADKVESRLTYKTGEISGPGTLVCHRCQRELHMQHVGHVPPCPECRGVEFHRSY